jgi:protein tyrosine phosphatase (PTP) superfamily phosphohydrolase (DUF442 family)
MTPQRSRRYFRWRSALVGLAAVVMISLAGAWYFGMFNDNFRVVVPGQLYRSGQMTQVELRETIAAHGIRTILNLRGASVEPWYSEEVKAAKELGVRHVDIALSATCLPPPDKAADLVRAFREGPYPMLLHCRAGADRTGLACAVYEMAVARRSLDQALRGQLTWRYKHFAIGKWRAMDDFFELYRRTSGGKDLAQWILDDYPAIYARQNGASPPG